MSQDISRISSIRVSFYFPKALIEAQLFSDLILEFLEDDVLAVGRKHAPAA
jgi:hypothetical protein